MANTTHNVSYPTGGCAVFGKWDMGHRRTIYRRKPKPQPTPDFQPKSATPAATVRQELVWLLELERNSRSRANAIAAIRILENLNPGKLLFTNLQAFLDLCRRSADDLGMDRGFAGCGISQIHKTLKSMDGS